MKISELWLREWVNPTLTSSQLAAQLTMAGLEVDAVTPVAQAFTKVIVAKVIAVKPHPKADRLSLCEVDTGSSIVPVVCGANNVRPNLMVALALPGAALPKEMIIKETSIRGEPSKGMLCSESELSIAESSQGILELPEDAPLGEDLRHYLKLDDHILDIDLTPNRADCLSVLGVAREVAVLNRLTFTDKPIKAVHVEINDSLAVSVMAPEACPNYAGRIIKNINPHVESPLWLKEKLRRCGLRSVHPVVDVTNYVMLELGQPLHAFDKKAIQGSIQVRFASNHETLTLIDNQEVKLNDNTLIIADENKPLAIAGVMGGLNSAVNCDTTEIFLESAFFYPLIIAGVARKYGVVSDASQRFERGVDPAIQVRSLERATELLLSIVGGEPGPITLSSGSPTTIKLKTIAFNPNKVEQLTGVNVSTEETLQILECLGMKVEVTPSNWQVTIPSYRFDIAIEVDLVEEIIRVFGYEKIGEGELVSLLKVGILNPLVAITNKITSFLPSRGYHEAINYSFVDPTVQEALFPEACSMKLVNPISSELSNMRVSLWPGLIASMIYNVNRQLSTIKLFESGVIFRNNSQHLQEVPSIAGLIMGEDGPLNWSHTKRKFDFFDMKGDLQSLFSHLNFNNVEFIAGANSALHPGKTAKIVIDGNEIGWLGVLHPKIAAELQLADEVVLFEISLNVLLKTPVVKYQPLSKYPQVRRDLSFLVDKRVEVSEIKKIVMAQVPNDWLKTFDIFDVYMGHNIPENKKSIAIALTVQNKHRTLTDIEINDMISVILDALTEQFAIVLRD